jgi:nucleoside triphosphate diphosphatase
MPKETSEPTTTGARFERAVAIMARLRGPGGCPWDREQTFDSIKPYTVEETYEVLDAIDKRDWEELPAELGDLLLQVLFYSQMASEEKTFSIDDVLDRLCAKLINRHPHVFGDVEANTSSEVLRNWEAIKSAEKVKKQSPAEPKQTSILVDLSSAMPALTEASKLGSRAARVGFDWPDANGLIEKLREETKELEQELSRLPSLGEKPSGELRSAIEGEIGDLFFTLVNLTRHLSVDSESALRRSNRKFRQRFQNMEAQCAASGRDIAKLSANELESLWRTAKQQESVAK